MNCPKCNSEINENMLACPNCKKVLKLCCPKCNTINLSNSCKKCGFTIIAKCHKCGKINKTIDGKCKKCGFSTYSSIAINTSNIDEFACLIIKFQNLEEIKSTLDSTKLFKKFKANLDNLIFNYVSEHQISREIINGYYVVRFNKDYSFSDSAKNALKGSIEILNLITKLNFKLFKLKHILLQCNIEALKLDINSMPSDYVSACDVKIIHQDKVKKLLNGLQVITDLSIYEQVCDEFDLSMLNSTFINGRTVMFFELNIKKHIEIPVEKENEENLQILSKLPAIDENISAEDSLYNVDSINFDELSVCFTNADATNIATRILNKLQKNPKNIIAIQSDNELAGLSDDLLTRVCKLNKFENVFRISCHDNMKYEPYGFFREFISNICDFSIAPTNFYLNNFEMFKTIDSSNYIYNLINAQPIERSNPDETRNSLFHIFFNIFASLSGSLIYIEDFDKIDDSSYEILQVFLEQFEELNISYVVTMDKDFSLHKNAHFLLSNCCYTNITMKTVPLSKVLAKDIKKYQEILKDYCIEKIAQNFKGNLFYFQQAIEYLIETNYLALNKDGDFVISNTDNILIPTSLKALIAKRFKNLATDKDAYNLFGSLLLIGPRIDFKTISLLGIENEKITIQKLLDKNYISNVIKIEDEEETQSIFVNNYSSFKNNFLSITDKETLQEIASNLLKKIFPLKTPLPAKSLLYRILEINKSEIINWEGLSLLNSSFSDFSAYLNCSDNLLKLVDENISEHSKEGGKDYKTEIYENVSTLLHKFSPNKAKKITQLILDNLNNSTDDEKTVQLCSKMLQGCLNDGSYAYAFDLVSKILSKFSNLSLNPLNQNFNISFFMLSLVKIEILFSIGNLKDCIDSGEELLNSLNTTNIQQIKPQHLSMEQFKGVIFDALSFVTISKTIKLNNDLNEFITKIQTNIGKIPEYFYLFFELDKAIKGFEFKQPNIQVKDDKFSNVFFSILNAFSNNDDYKKFADNLHQAKVNAKKHKLFQIELMCDLLIGYSYFNLNLDKKASAIYHNVIEFSIKNGIRIVTYIDWYLMSMLNYKQGEIEIAFGIASNTIIQLEKDSNSSDYILFLFRILFSKILMVKNEKEAAESCLNNANFIKEKYGLNFELNEEKI